MMNKWSCGYCKGLKMLILGVLILLNQLYLRWEIWTFLAVVFIIWGVIGLFSHGSCKCNMEAEMLKEMPKKRKR